MTTTKLRRALVGLAYRGWRSPATGRGPILVLGAIVCAALATGSAAQSSRVHVDATAVASPAWLNEFNAWRGNAGTSALSENATWSAGDVAHATYMVKSGLVTHYEDPSNPYYTAAGDAAAKASNIYVSSSTATSDVQAIDWWMGAPFHAMAMMDPRLVTTGFGSYRDTNYSSWHMGAALDVADGMTAPGQYPVYFPGNGSTEPLTSFSGNEFPDPTSACPGATGLPLFVEVGANVSTVAGPIHTLTANGAQLANCVIDSTNPTFASYLKWRGAVIVFPQQSLQNGTTYAVSVTVNLVPYTWSFAVGALSSQCNVAPSVTSIAPAQGPASGGTTVTINGCKFTGTTGVRFGATAAASFHVVSDSQVAAVSPVGAAGAVDVTVTNAGGSSLADPADVFTFLTPPGPPTNVTATLGNLAATVSWTPPVSDGGSPITSYTVTSSPGGLTSTVSGASHSTVISGLTIGVNFTFTVVATNSIGSGSASQPSNSIVAATVPSAPAWIVATPSAGSAIVEWGAPAYNGGSPIIGYVVTPYANGVTAGTPVFFSQRNLLEVVFGLTNGVTYSFTVAAVSVPGAGAASNLSNSVVPSAPLRQASGQESPAYAGPRSGIASSGPAPAPSPR